ncbi:MAG TPA: hypothetical protein VHY34_09795 [Caulobacteraceae bacterium]|jgi:hypothetical protein|nr:hypothetical protein [Caulobacteraceae bacterium]
MKHAGQEALDALEAVRLRRALTERKRGVFYRKSRAWLHFHEDPAGLFADLRGGCRLEPHRRHGTGRPDRPAAPVGRTDRALDGFVTTRRDAKAKLAS